jgi:hypothetical protein
MPSRRVTDPVCLLLAAFAISVPIGCGGTAVATPAPTASPTPTRSASPSATPEQTALPTPSPTAAASPTPGQPTTFESVVYPYTLTLPAGTVRRLWRPATVAWDGKTPINRTTSSVDGNGTTLGDLIVFGLPASDPAVLGGIVEDNTSRFNGCRLTNDPKPLDVNGVPGVTYAQVCAQGTTALTVAVVNEGYGLTFRVVEYRKPDAEVLAELTEWVAGATWPVAR